MSSNDFTTIFDRAAEIVRIRSRDLPGLETVLGAIRNRIVGTKERDPRRNRDLFFEPWMDVQILEVRHDTAEEVARQLLELTILRLWTRVKCPGVPPEEDGIIFETDSDAEFTEKLSQVCPHCGTTHDLVPSQLEAVYAPNFPGKDGLTKFDYEKLKPKTPLSRKRGQTTRRTTPEDRGDLQRCEDIAQAEVSKDTPVVVVVALALGHNSHPTEVPTPTEAWWHIWLGPLLILIIYMVLIAPITIYCGTIGAIIVSTVVLVVVYFTISGHVRAKLAPSALQRLATRWGIYVSIVLIAAGTTGVEFSAKDDNQLSIPVGENKQIMLPLRFEYGTVNHWLLGVGVLCFLATLLFVLIYDQKIGWLTPSKDTSCTS